MQMTIESETRRDHQAIAEATSVFASNLTGLVKGQLDYAFEKALSTYHISFLKPFSMTSVALHSLLVFVT